MESLGLNPVLLIAQLISFGILYAVLNKFLYPVISRALKDRHEAVAKTYADREEVKQQLDEWEEKQKKEQKKVLEESRKLLAEASKSAQIAREEMLKQAETESRRIVEKAQIEIDRRTTTAQKEIGDYAKQLARKTVESLLTEKAQDPNWQDQQIRQSLKHVKT